jgi:hypothetical protein
MSTLTSSSTRAEINAAYLDNASYEEDGSVAKAKAFITACRFLLLPKITPSRSAGPGDGGEVEFNLDMIKVQMEAAQQYVAANDTSNYDGFGTVRHVDFTGLRD